MHAVKNPGQTPDGIIMQLIGLWDKQKQQEAVEGSQPRGMTIPKEMGTAMVE